MHGREVTSESEPARGATEMIVVVVLVILALPVLWDVLRVR